MSLVKPTTPLKSNNILFKTVINKNKLFLKQSYLFLILLHQVFSNARTKDTIAATKTTFCILAKNTNVMTITKGPMAHKQWSQEQYTFKYYLIHLSTFINDLFASFFININYSFWLLKIIQTILIFETNTLLHLYTQYNLYFTDFKYLQLK